MSSLFDAPAQLVMLLASVVAGQEPVESTEIEPIRAAIVEQGPYAFSETNWLAAIRKGFGGASLEPFRGRIFATSSGRLYIPVVAEKNDILAARQRTPEARAVALGEARFNAAELRNRLGREAGVKDLYAAHMLGLDVAARLAWLKATRPNALAATALSDLAASFPQAVMQKGAPVTVAEVYRRLPEAPHQNVALGLSTSDGRGEASDSAVPTSAPKPPAPLRGGIKDEVAIASGSNEGWFPAQLALEWTTEVYRAPASP